MGDYLTQVEEQLVELTERGAHRRPRPRLDLLAVGSAIAVVVAVVVAVATIGQNPQRHTASHGATAEHPAKRHRSVVHHRTGTTTGRAVSVASPSGGPVPAGFGPVSFTALGEFNWWLLGSAPCSSPPCTSVVRTTNGGRSFVGIPAPRTNQVSQLRFVSPTDAFAYGPQLWVTHDAGFDWYRIRSTGQVTELAAGGGYAYAIVNNSKGGGSLDRAAIGSDTWRTLPVPGAAYSGLWVHGSYVLLETDNPSGTAQNLAISTDYGEHFVVRPVPPSVACQFEMPAPPVVWAHCATGMMSGTWRSTNEGRSFEAARGGPPQLPNSAVFGSASPTTAVVGYRQLYRTTDGGSTWAPVSGPSGITWWQYLGFTDPTHGVAIGYVGSPGLSRNERLYYTTDGGASYHRVRIR